MGVIKSARWPASEVYPVNWSHQVFLQWRVIKQTRSYANELYIPSCWRWTVNKTWRQVSTRSVFHRGCVQSRDTWRRTTPLLLCLPYWWQHSTFPDGLRSNWGHRSAQETCKLQSRVCIYTWYLFKLLDVGNQCI